MFPAVAVGLALYLFPYSGGGYLSWAIHNPRHFEPVSMLRIDRSTEEPLDRLVRLEAEAKADMKAIEQGILQFEQLGGDPAKLPALYAHLEKARRYWEEREEELNNFLETKK